ncbi:hypothetical protein ACHAWF_005862, partial [Thalassiosira exigua]
MILHGAEHAVSDRDLGISSMGINLLNSRRDRESDVGSGSRRRCAWDIRYLRELKLACVREVVESLRSEGDTSVGTAGVRGRLLCALIGSSASEHGKQAARVWNGGCICQDCRRGEKKERSKGANAETAIPQYPYDLTFASCLLVLVLGDRVSRPILKRHHNNRAKVEALLGPIEEPTTVKRVDADRLAKLAPASQDQEAQQPVVTPRAMDHDDNLGLNRVRFERAHERQEVDYRHERAPMPFRVAERTVDLISTQLLPRDPENIAHSPNISSSCIVSYVGGLDRPALGLVVDLILSLKDQKGKVGAYWAVRILGGIMVDLLPLHPLMNAEGRQVLGEMEQQQDQGRHVPGVPGPFGARHDLNKLLADHRVSQRRRQLRDSSALQARVTAYRIGTDLAPRTVGDRLQQLKNSAASADTKDLCSGLFEIPIILLGCAVGEEDVGMHPFVTKALGALLGVFKEFKNALSESQIAPLLPSLLCAVCSGSSAARLGAAEWAVDFIRRIDPPVSRHICLFLSEDGDPFVSAVAKRGLLKMPDISTGSVVELSLGQDKAYIQTDLDKKVRELALAVDLPPSAARIVLGHHVYDTAKAQREIKSNRSKIIGDRGVISLCNHRAASPSCQGNSRSNHQQLCEICYDESYDFFALSCTHKFCCSCWQDFLKDGLQAWSQGPPKIECPGQNCMERVTREAVATVAPHLIPQWDMVELRSM